MQQCWQTLMLKVILRLQYMSNKKARKEKDYNFRGLIYAKLSNYQVQFIHSKYHSCVYINNNITGE